MAVGRVDLRAAWMYVYWVALMAGPMEKWMGFLWVGWWE